MIASPFPVRPRPHLDESFIGYFMRVSASNGREVFSEMNRIVKVPTRQSNFDVGHPSHGEFLELVAPYLQCNPDDLRNSGAFNTPLSDYDPHRGIQDIRVFTPKLCPQCLMEDGYFHLDWQSQIVTHCQHHQVSLVDLCPECGRAMIWHSDIFQGCPHDDCGYTWNDHHVTNDQPSFLIYLGTIEACKQQEAVRHLVTVAAMLMRPFDLLHQNRKKVTISNQEMCTYLQQAHALLIAPELLDTWFLTLNAVNPYIGLLRSPIESYISTHQGTYRALGSNSTRLTLPCGPFEQNSLITKDRKRLITSITDAHYHVDSTTARSFLRLDLESFNTLRDHHRIKPINNPRLLRDELFDIRSLDGLLKDLLNSTACQAVMDDSLTPLSELMSLSQLFGLNAGHVLEILFNHPDEVASSSEPSTSWASLLLDRQVYIQLLEKYYRNYLPDRTSISTLKRMLCVTEPQLKRLLVICSIKVFQSSCRHDVETSDVISLLSNVCILNREAMLIGNITTQSLHMKLEQRGHATESMFTERGLVVLMKQTVQLQRELLSLRESTVDSFNEGTETSWGIPT